MEEYSEAIMGFVGGVLVTLAKDYTSNRKRAKYLAVRIVISLDKFIDECVDLAEHADYSQFRRPETPKIDNYPEDLDFKSIDSSTAYKILNLSQQISDIKRSVEWKFEDEGGNEDARDEAFDLEQRLFSCLALEVKDLVDGLRKKYDIPQIESNSNYDSWKKIKEHAERQKKSDVFNFANQAITPPLGGV